MLRRLLCWIGWHRYDQVSASVIGYHITKEYECCYCDAKKTKDIWMSLW